MKYKYNKLTLEKQANPRWSLIQHGYRIQKVNKRIGQGVLMSTIHKLNSDSVYTYMVAIDRLRLKRDYMIGKDNIIAPASSLFVRGVAPDIIVLNDSLFYNPDVQIQPIVPVRH